MGIAQWIVVALAVLRLSELVHGRRNTKRLLAGGGVEIGRRHYPWIVALHGAWLAVLFLVIPADAAADYGLLGLFVLLQCLRVWVMVSLGRYWTTRIIAVPGAALVRSGPYRFLRHPNYLVVAGEIAVLPLAFGAWKIAVIFSILNAVLLALRIRVEDAANANRRPISD